ncbi:MAG: fibro-slime domain-containing protein [Tepidisphaera sp.]
MLSFTHKSSGRAVAAIAGLCAIAGVGSLVVGGGSAIGNNSADQYAALPSSIQIDATIRDFKANGESGGHPDFQFFSGSTTVGLVASTLDNSGKPTVASLRGQTISTEFRDSAGRFIMPSLFDASRGDVLGRLAAGGTGNGLTSAERFSQWYRDVPGVNVSKRVPLTLNRVANTNRYVFDSATDAPYSGRGGFFPINGELYGNYSNTGRNFHFTTEINTEFVYKRGMGQVFKFTGDDDVWVFIGGRLAIDLGGLHSRKEQFVDLDRLNWLTDGQTYRLDIFHAERRTTQSNFRFECTLELRSVSAPTTSNLHD